MVVTKTIIRLYSTTGVPLNRKIGLIGGCFDKGQPKDGVQTGPRAIRENGLIQKLDDFHVDYKDYGDVHVKDVLNDLNQHDHQQHSSSSQSTNSESTQSTLINNSKLKNVNMVANYSKLLSEKVHQCLKDERVCLNIGGDHTLAIGSLLGHINYNPKFSVLWIDAHGDVNTEKTTKSGNLHGMVLSFFVQGIQHEYENSPELSTLFHSIKPNLDCSSLCYIGIRDLDPLERHLLDSLQIKYFTMGDVDKLGITETTSRALEILKPSQNKPLHVSFDVDSLDPSYAPSTGTPIPGGLTLDEALSLAKTVGSTNLIKCLDWVEVNPQIGQPKDVDKTIENSISILLSFLGFDKKTGLNQHG